HPNFLRDDRYTADVGAFDERRGKTKIDVSPLQPNRHLTAAAIIETKLNVGITVQIAADRLGDRRKRNRGEGHRFWVLARAMDRVASSFFQFEKGSLDPPKKRLPRFVQTDAAPASVKQR